MHAVSVDIFGGPIEHRVIPGYAVRPRDRLFHVRPNNTLIRPHATDPDIKALEIGFERRDLVEVTALIRISGEEKLPIAGALLGFRDTRADIDHSEIQALGELIAKAQCLREVIAGIEEDDIDGPGMRCEDVQQRQALGLERRAREDPKPTASKA
ncbi:hypothetical protein V6X71_08610 [Spiribacter sp. 388]